MNIIPLGGLHFSVFYVKFQNNRFLLFSGEKAMDEHVHTHTYTDENGEEHTYTHSHKHKHHHESSKAVINRLARAIGHLEKVKKMVEDDEDCTDVLMQLAAVRSALNGTAQVILKDHIEHCIVDAVDSNDLESIDALNKAIEQFMK